MPLLLSGLVHLFRDIRSDRNVNDRSCSTNDEETANGLHVDAGSWQLLSLHDKEINIPITSSFAGD